jgi:hypothetical protein
MFLQNVGNHVPLISIVSKRLEYSAAQYGAYSLEKTDVM